MQIANNRPHGKRELYTQVKAWSEEYYNAIISIDYRTITEESFMQKISPYLIFALNKSQVCAYVKENEIIIEGNSKLQIPIIYYAGSYYRLRMKINFEIKHSKTKDNLLYLDWLDGGKKIYTKNSYDIIAD